MIRLSDWNASATPIFSITKRNASRPILRIAPHEASLKVGSRSRCIHPKKRHHFSTKSLNMVPTGKHQPNQPRTQIQQQSSPIDALADSTCIVLAVRFCHHIQQSVTNSQISETKKRLE